jgi:NAD(P)-dependent dehydrogenase (short-subunit alcohol dehydrogenase family)
VILDVTNSDHIARVVDELATAVGAAGLQGLVNNAGVGVGGPVEILPEDAWRFVFDANFFGIVALTRAALPLLRTGRGRIVHIGSIGGRIASPGVAPYSASKHALEALAEASRIEFALGGSPVRVALVEPGAVVTPIWGKADDSVDALERVFSDDQRVEYAWMVDQVRGFVDEGRRTGVPPSKVADAVVHALVAPRPKLRYLVGPDAKVAGHLIARLPDRVREALVMLQAKRWRAVGAALRRERSPAS